MIPIDRLRHIFAHELLPLVQNPRAGQLRRVLRRGSQVLGWRELEQGVESLLHLPEEGLLQVLSGWIPLLQAGQQPVLGLPRTPTLPSDPPQVRSSGSPDIRVSLQQLEALFAHAGELTVLKNRMEERLRQLQGLEADLIGLAREVRLHFTEKVRQLRQDHFELHRISEELTAEVIDLRLRPASLMLTPLERLVRDLARVQGKKVHFEVQGADTELDRNLLDPLRDSLMHLIRNAIDHGLEPPAERKAGHKNEMGRLQLSIHSRGEAIHLTLQDDGRGIQPEKVLKKALERGLISQGQTLTPDAIHDLLFQPGFSTAEQVSDISGRGVGLDAVRAQLKQLGGEVWLTSTVGQGTTFHLRVPQTLATTRAFVLQVSGQRFALPSRHVDRVLKPGHFTTVDGKRTVEWQGTAIPTFDLADLLDLSPTDASYILVLNLAERSVGVGVEQVLSEEEFVIKPLPWGVPPMTHFQGMVMDRSGTLLPVLNVTQFSEHARPRKAPQPAPKKQQQRILVVDDSVAVRTIQRSILEMAGFEVQVAENGHQALIKLRAQPFDLVVSDIEMPEMTGLDLTRSVRQDPLLHHLPIILVTSMASPHHQEEGMLAGADAYLIKGNYAPEDLLDTIGRLI